MMSKHTWQSGAMQSPPAQSPYLSGTGYPGMSQVSSAMRREVFPTVASYDSPLNTSSANSNLGFEVNSESFFVQTTNSQFKIPEPVYNRPAESLMEKRGHYEKNFQDKLHFFQSGFNPTVLENDQTNSNFENAKEIKSEFDFEIANLPGQISNSTADKYIDSSWIPPQTCSPMVDDNKLSEILTALSTNLPEDQLAKLYEEMAPLIESDLFYKPTTVSPYLRDESTDPSLISGEHIVPELLSPQNAQEYDFIANSRLESTCLIGAGESGCEMSMTDIMETFADATVLDLHKNINLLDYLHELPKPPVQPVTVLDLPVQPGLVQSVPITAARFPAPLQPQPDAPAKKRGRPKRVDTGIAKKMLAETFGINVLPEGHPLPLSCMDRPARGAKLACQQKMATPIEDDISSSSTDLEYIPELIDLLPRKRSRRSNSEDSGSSEDCVEKRKKNNEASKKSREKKKELDREREKECAILETRNEKLKYKCKQLQDAVELGMQKLRSVRMGNIGF